MPFIHVSIGKKIEVEEKRKFAEEIGRLVTILPEKTFAKTMIRIDDDCAIYRGGQQTTCAFIETRLHQEAELKYKTEYTAKIFELFETALGIPKDQVYFNLLELKHWASKGVLR